MQLYTTCTLYLLVFYSFLCDKCIIVAVVGFQDWWYWYIIVVPVGSVCWFIRWSYYHEKITWASMYYILTLSLPFLSLAFSSLLSSLFCSSIPLSIWKRGCTSLYSSPIPFPVTLSFVSLFPPFFILFHSLAVSSV